MKPLEIKKALIAACKAHLVERMAFYKHSMENAMMEANEHKEMTGSMFDTYKDDTLSLRNGFSMQLQKVNEAFALIDQVPLKDCSAVSLGALVKTNGINFFIAGSAIDEAITIGKDSYNIVSLASPLMRQLEGKRAGTKVRFLNQTWVIETVE